MAMINCSKCGKEIPDKAAFCQNCGCPVNVPQRENAAPQILFSPPVHRAGAPQKRGSCLQAALVVFCAFFILIVLIGAIGGKDKEEEGTAQKGAETQVGAMVEGEERVEESPVEEAEPEPTSNIFHVGEILETKKVKLSYLSCGEYSDSNMFVEAGEGNKLVYFEFEFENIGDTDTHVGYIDFNCYADGYEAQDTLPTADNAMTSIADLSPGRKMSGIVVFEVPQNAESIEVEYETSYWTQDKAIFVYE